MPIQVLSGLAARRLALGTDYNSRPRMSISGTTWAPTSPRGIEHVAPGRNGGGVGMIDTPHPRFELTGLRIGQIEVPNDVLGELLQPTISMRCLSSRPVIEMIEERRQQFIAQGRVRERGEEAFTHPPSEIELITRQPFDPCCEQHSPIDRDRLSKQRLAVPMRLVTSPLRLPRWRCGLKCGLMRTNFIPAHATGQHPLAHSRGIGSHGVISTIADSFRAISASRSCAACW